MIPRRTSGRLSGVVATIAGVMSLGCGSAHTASPGSGGVATAAAGGGANPAGGAGGGTAGGGAAALPFDPGGGPSTSGAAGTCGQTGEACTNSGDCCPGSTCNNTAQAATLNGCHPRCAQDADCQTGCCVLYTGDTRGICADAMWCGCGMNGARCGSDQPKCCGDQLCLAGNAQQAFYECTKRCSANVDCPTNCCVAIPNLGASACLDPMYCPAPNP